MTESRKSLAAIERGRIARLDLAGLLGRLRDYHARYVAFGSDHPPIVLALWDAHTWAIDAFDVTPRLHFTSAVPASGKSTAQESVAKVSRDPLETYTATPAAVYRFLQQRPRTVLIDETDTTWTPNGSDDRAVMLRGVLDAGHRRGKKVAVCIAKGREQVPMEFETFSPVVLAGMGDLPDTLESRCIVIRMKRRTADEQVQRFRYREVAEETAPLRDALKAWASASVIAQLRAARPAIPAGLSDRAADCWEPLLAIADLAGGDWPERARAAAVALTDGVRHDDQSIGVRLLADLHTTWKDTEPWLPTETILERLHTLEESPWRTWGRKGDGLNAHQLGRLLRPFDVTSGQEGSGDRRRGFSRADLADAWHRNLPHPHPEEGSRNLPHPHPGEAFEAFEAFGPAPVLAPSRTDRTEGTLPWDTETADDDAPNSSTAESTTALPAPREACGDVF